MGRMHALHVLEPPIHQTVQFPESVKSNTVCFFDGQSWKVPLGMEIVLPSDLVVISGHSEVN